MKVKKMIAVGCLAVLCCGTFMFTSCGAEEVKAGEYADPPAEESIKGEEVEGTFEQAVEETEEVTNGSNYTMLVKLTEGSDVEEIQFAVTESTVQLTFSGIELGFSGCMIINEKQTETSKIVEVYAQNGNEGWL